MKRRNQTNPGYFRMIANSSRPVKGVGLFVVRTRGRLVKQITPDITYFKTKEIGFDAIAFKFIPYNIYIRIDGVRHEFTSFQSIPKSKWRCVGRCTVHEDCQHLSEVCICAQGECL